MTHPTHKTRPLPYAIITLATAFAVLAVLASPGPADAQKKRVKTDELVAQLSHDAFARRESAMTELMLRDDFDDTALSKAMRAADHPEQRHRLERIALHRFYDRFNPALAPREQGPGALGIISLSNSNVVRPTQHDKLRRPAMIVSQTRPGFPAYVHLRPGDLILGLGGQLFDDSLDQNDFSQMIQRYRAGEILQMALLRNGERVDVRLKLDSLQRLHDVHQYLAQFPQVQMDPRWKAHLRDLRGEAPTSKPIVLDPPDADAAEDQSR